MKSAFLAMWIVYTGALGCGSGAGSDGSGGGSGGTAGTDGSPALSPLDSVPSFAVVSSDYSETSIAVLGDGLEVIDESWINSGTVFAGLVATLSGDVVLPTRQAGDGSFAIVDRFRTDVVSRFFVPSGELNGQVRTHGELANYSSNPHDLIFVHEASSWATRYAPNLDPDAAPENEGTDLVEVDPIAMTLTGQRIALSSLNTRGVVVGTEPPVEVDVYARPSRGVLVGATLVVGLDRQSGRFDAAGPGMVAVVDLDDGSVEGLLLGDELASCGHVVPVPDAPSRVVVACTGFARPFGEKTQTRASAGIVLLEVDADGASVALVWRAATDPASAIAVNGLVALGGSRIAAVDFGDSAAGTADVLYSVDLETGKQRKLHESGAAFEIGSSAYDPGDGRLYVPDAGRNEVLELVLEEDGATEVGSIRIAPSIGFPPRAVYRLNMGASSPGGGDR